VCEKIKDFLWNEEKIGGGGGLREGGEGPGLHPWSSKGGSLSVDLIFLQGTSKTKGGIEKYWEGIERNN